METKMKKKGGYRSRRFLFLAGLFAVPLIIALLIFALQGIIPTPSELRVREEEAEAAQAWQRWETANLQDYRYTYRTYYLCRVIVEVRGGISSIQENNCGYVPEPLMIPELFDEIAEVNAARKCGHNGCYCDGHLIADADYDEVYGYPLVMSEHLTDLPANWESRNYCTEMGTGGNYYTIENFEVLQGN
jgi:hypothetical protein